MKTFNKVASKLKYFFLSLIFIFLVSLPSFNEVVSSPKTYSSVNDFKYERVLIEGVWWIFVYDGDVLIHSYPEDDID